MLIIIDFRKCQILMQLIFNKMTTPDKKIILTFFRKRKTEIKKLIPIINKIISQDKKTQFRMKTIIFYLTML